MPKHEPSPIHLPSRYPQWLMDFVTPKETKKSYQHGPGSGDGTDKSNPPEQPAFTHVITIPPTPQQPTLQQPALQQPVPAPTAAVHPPDLSPDSRKLRPRRVRTREEQDEADKALLVKFARRLFAEFVGTFILVYLVAGVALEFNLTGAGIDRTAAGLNQSGAGYASGLTLVFLVYTMGPISGAHFNPVVTSGLPPTETHKAHRDIKSPLLR